MNFFSDQMRRDPFPLYAQLRAQSPVFRIPPPFDAWAILDYEGVKWALADYQTFSSSVPAPANWFIFFDPPRHTKLRSLITRAFVPRMVANLDQRIRELSRELLDQSIERGEMDLATDYSIPLPMKVISEMIGVPAPEWERFKRWSDTILSLSYARSEAGGGAHLVDDFVRVTEEMSDYLRDMIERRRRAPANDLLTALMEAVVDGQRLSHEEILGFFQLLIVGGQETTTNLINNAIVCLLDHPDQMARLRRSPGLIPSAIEEVLRYRSPLQWMMRTPRQDVEIQGQIIPAGKLVLAMIGSANRDPRQFSDPDRFDITREPNLHVAFGHGIHACLGGALARLEARIALGDLLGRLKGCRLAVDEPWAPRQALHVHGPARLPICFEPGRPLAAASIRPRAATAPQQTPE